MSNIINNKQQIISERLSSRQSKETIILQLQLKMILIVLISMGQLQLQLQAVSDSDEYYCPELTCKGMVIRFPFRVLYQSFQSCGYPGFELTSYSTQQPPLIHFPLNNSNNTTTTSITFEVTSISYIDQQIQLSLPKPGRGRGRSRSRCLAKELISLNTSATPFNYDYFSSSSNNTTTNNTYYYNNNNNNIVLIFFTLYNCSRHDANHRFPELERIECMSGLSYTVVSIQDEHQDQDQDHGRVVGGTNSNSTTSFNIHKYCDKIAQLKLLTTTTTTGIDNNNNRKNLSDIRSFFLGWDEPAECRKCELEGKRCRFKNYNYDYDYNWGSRSLPLLECYDPDKDDDDDDDDVDDASPRKTTKMAVIVGMAFGLGIPALILLTLVFYAYIKPPQQQQQQHHHHQATNTNDAATTASASNASSLNILLGSSSSWCPVVVLGESGRLLANSEDKSCAICLSDYQPKDALRLIPNCSHTFHAQCIDHWLLTTASNPTCPLCRIQFPTSPP